MSVWDRIKKALSGASSDEAPAPPAPVARRPASLGVPPAPAAPTPPAAEARAAEPPAAREPVPEPAPQAPAAPPAPPPEPPRRHHVTFALGALPGNLWAADGMLGVLVNPENQDFLRAGWADVGSRVADDERLDDAGLACSSHWLGGRHLVLLVTLPKALRCGEAHFAAVTTSPRVRYLVLERGASESATVLAECTRRGERAEIGPGPEPEARAFLHAICRLLGVPESVEAPLPAQLLGFAKDPGKVALPEPRPLTEAAAARVAALEASIEQALAARDGATAESLLREALALRLEVQGVDSPDATLMHAGIVQALMQQDRLDAAEAECEAWWALCRRHRAVAHQETLLAMRLLATCRTKRGDRSGALALLTERALLAGLARGASSAQATQARAELDAALAARAAAAT